MVKFKEVRKRTKEVSYFLLRTIKLIWKSSKISFIVTLIVALIDGIMAPLTLVISKYLIDSVISSLNKGEDYRNVVFWLLIEFIFAILGQVIKRINTYYSVVQVRSLNNYIAELIVKKSNELDLSFFENSDFYNKIEKVNNFNF